MTIFLSWMLNKTRQYSSLVILLFYVVFGQSISVIDTVIYSEEHGLIQLTHPFLIDSSLSISNDGKIILPEKVYPFDGKVLIGSDIEYDTLIFSYDFLKIDLPLLVGPKWTLLPKLDLYSNSSSENFVIDDLFTEDLSKSQNIFSSGNIYRQISLNPMGGSDFTGGLQMQINGNLFDDIQISGVLTDQDMPIQAEGSTRNLDELDQVYLSVIHPNYSFNAGDIIFEESNESHNIKRKLIGISNSFNIDDLSVTAVYAGSRGDFNSIEFTGRDGDQGPYTLSGKDGSKDIIILSGTEKIWANGIELIRGKNYDYIIDYSLAEITFTPNILIHSDMDIYIEYQYSNYDYERGFSGGSLQRSIGRSGNLSFGIFNEKDNIVNKDWSSDIKDSLYNSTSAIIKLNTAIIDNDGDYIKEDSLYIYTAEMNNLEAIHYSVNFQFDQNGSYSRNISNSGRIYYKYIPVNERSNNIDYYSPHRIINAPKNHQYGFFDGKYTINEMLSLSSYFSGSKYDNNSVNKENSINSISFKLGIQLDSISFGPIALDLRLTDWKRNKDYRPLGRENEITQRRFWNLDSALINDVRETSLSSRVIMKNIGNTEITLAKLFNGHSFRSRLLVDQSFTNKLYNKSFFNYTVVKKNRGLFYRANSRIQFNYNRVEPFLTFLGEEESSLERFRKIGGGFNFKNEKRRFEIGADLQENDIYQESSLWDRQSNDFVGFFNYQSLSNKGFKKRINFKKRIKAFLDKSEHYDYSLLDLFISHELPHKPLNWDIQLRKEESLSEQRATVYDSVGIGLGKYRYDPNFNIYISDPNGSFIAYTIHTGNRVPNSNIHGSQRFTFDLGKLNAFSEILIRGNSRQDFQASEQKFHSLLFPNISDSSISRSNIYSRLEILSEGRNPLLGWFEHQLVLNGLDPRGTDINRYYEYGIELDRMILKYFSLQNRFSLRSGFFESTISSLRERDMKGWWNELQFQLNVNNNTDIDIGFINGFDKGRQQGKEFSASAKGLTLQGKLLFNRTGRFQTEITIIDVDEEKGSSYLPPEVLNSYPVGSSFRTNTQFQYLFNRSLSLILTLGTINDQRYNNFVSFKGEMRAHF